MASLEMAAKDLVQPISGDPENAPRTCHEGVVGWLLIALGYPRAWQLLRRVGNRFPAGQVNFQWMWANLYQGNSAPLTNATVQTTAMPGDVLWSGTPNYPIHSMVVVSRVASVAPGVPAIVNVRGVNNFGTFNASALARHLPPPPAVMVYDIYDRDVAHPTMWAAGAPFGPGPNCLYHVPGFIAKMRVAQAIPWESSQIPIRNGARWHHNPFQGWHWG